MGGIVLVFMLIFVLWLITGQSMSRKAYAGIGYLLVVIWLLRFACPGYSCISYTFLFDIGSHCATICQKCEMLLKDVSILHLKEGEKACLDCSKCKPDWNIRFAFDTSGLALIGLFLADFFLYKKDYSIYDLLKGLDSLNLFGVLVIKVDDIESDVDELIEDLDSDLKDEGIQEEVSEEYTTIVKESQDPINALHQLHERVEAKYKHLAAFFSEQSNIISSVKKEQFRALSGLVENFTKLIKRDGNNTYINSMLLIAKKLLIVVYAILDYIQYEANQAPPERRKHLTTDIGIDIGDRYKTDVYDIILRKGTTIPAEETKNYGTIFDEQDSVPFSVYVGNNPIASKNKRIGGIELTGIPPMKAGKAKNSLSFKVDKAGFLLIKQICLETRNKAQTDIDINNYLSS